MSSAPKQVVEAGGKVAWTDLLANPRNIGQCTLWVEAVDYTVNVLCIQPGGRGWRGWKEGGLAQPSSQPQDPGQCTMWVEAVDYKCTLYPTRW
jgi:hypothetical protein